MPLAVTLAAVLLAKAPAAPERSAPGACPADARVEVNLPAWKASLEGATVEKRRDDLLAEVKLALDPPESDAPEGREPRLALAGVEDTVVQLEVGERADHVLHVRYRVDAGEDAPVIHLVQVLRPLAGRAYCALGDALSRRDEPPGRLVSYALTFVPLVSAKAKVIELETTVGEARRSETRRAYFAARGLKLHKIFDEATGRMQSAEGGGATTTTVATLALSGDFPRHIDLQTLTKRGGCEVRAGDTPCEESASGTPETTTFVFDGARYVRKR